MVDLNAIAARFDRPFEPVDVVTANDSILRMAMVHGEFVWHDLSQIGVPIDIVDIFRRPDAAGEAVDQAIFAGAKAVWMQIGVRNDAAAERAEAAGLKVVMNHCPKIEYSRLCGELGWSGVNSGIISSKRRLTR